MGALPTFDYPEDRERLYIEELREFFSTQGLHSGSLEDIVPFVDKLALPGLFRDDMRSMARSIIFRERGNIPVPMLMEVVAIAIAGSRIDNPPPQLSEPARKLRAFLGDVVRSRWGMAAVENEEPASPPAEEEMSQTVALAIPATSLAGGMRAADAEPLREPHTHPNVYSHPRALHPNPDESGSLSPASWTRRHSLWLAGVCAAAVVAVAIAALHHGGVAEPTQRAALVLPPRLPVANAERALRPAPPSKPTAYGEPVKRGRGVRSAFATPLSHDAYAAPVASATPPAAIPEASPEKLSTQPPAPIYRVAPFAAQPRAAAPLGAYPAKPAYYPASPQHQWVNVPARVMAGNLISAPAPQYPKLASFVHLEGSVVLEAIVSRNGSVVATQVLRGHRLLRGAAGDAVRRWRYRPYMLNGRPMDVATIITVDFER